jgi:hypothetical protein
MNQIWRIDEMSRKPLVSLLLGWTAWIKYVSSNPRRSETIRHIVLKISARFYKPVRWTSSLMSKNERKFVTSDGGVTPWSWLFLYSVRVSGAQTAPRMATELKAECCSEILAFECRSNPDSWALGPLKAELITNITVYRHNKYFSGSYRISSHRVNKGFLNCSV